jgi:hypothetical protein
MHITVNNEQIEITFNPYIYVNVSGPEHYYYVEVREYVKDNPESRIVEAFQINGNSDFLRDYNFYFFGEFYGDYEISVYKFVKNVGLQKIYNHRYNDCGKLVQFNLVTENVEEAKVWVNSINEYQRKHGCVVKVTSKFEEINNLYNDNKDSLPYKTYNIGRFLKTSTDFKSIGETRKHGNIWFGNWKVFWSYQHPRNWKELSSKEIADDILGLN